MMTIVAREAYPRKTWKFMFDFFLHTEEHMMIDARPFVFIGCIPVPTTRRVLSPTTRGTVHTKPCVQLQHSKISASGKKIGNDSVVYKFCEFTCLKNSVKKIVIREASKFSW